MFLDEIKLTKFYKYRKFDVEFSPLNFIRGRNGSGKTTLGQVALLFGIWGYCEKTLAEIPTRSQTGCSVEIKIRKDGSQYIVERKIPSALKVTRDGEELKFQNSAEAQSYINGIFGTALDFKKFRMIDLKEGVDFVDPKSATIFKQIMFCVFETELNSVKERLSKIKQEREIWNKDSAVIYPYAPSEKRFSLLSQKIALLEEEKNKAIQEERQIGQEEYQHNNLIGQIQGQIRNIESQKARMSATHCYACGAPLRKEQNAEIIAKQESNIRDLQIQLNEARIILGEIQEIRAQTQKPIQSIDSDIRRLSDLKLKLEGRLKQKNYIYTTRDVEIARQALKELDVISTTFLIKSIRNLEPIINEVLSKINYALEFDINDKGKFDMRLTHKNGEVFTYKDLSTGQRLMLQIAFKLALLLERGEEGLIIADEGLSSLDRENLLHILKIFENYPFQLICVLHHFDEIPAGIKTIDLDEVNDDEENQRVIKEVVGLDSGEGNKI